MDALKLIPQVFFDLIARVVPGLFLLVSFDATTQAQVSRRFLELLAPNDTLRGSTVVWILVVTLIGYLLGQLMSPAIRWLEKPPVIKTRVVATLIAKLPFSRSPAATLEQKRWRQYDWLRLEKPEAGGLVAKIRAEYTMYGGLAVAQLLMVPVCIAAAAGAAWRHDAWHTALRAGAAIAFVALSLSMLHRHCETYKTFGKSVSNFYAVAEGLPNWKQELKDEGPTSE